MGLCFSLRRLSFGSFEDLDSCSKFDAATLHSFDATPETARGVPLGNPFDEHVFEPVRPEAVDDLTHPQSHHPEL